MFVGHYAVGFALRAHDRRLSLGWMFAAVMFYDWIWSILVPLGVERISMVPELYAWVPVRFDHIPYSHSLLAALLWAAVLVGAYRLLAHRPETRVVVPWLVLATFSHWLLDLIVHRADLPIVVASTKVGFGLWNYRWASLLLETSMLVAALAWYVRATRARDRAGRIGLACIAGAMFVLGVGFYFFRNLPEGVFVACSAATFAGLTIAAFWLDRHRE